MIFVNNKELSIKYTPIKYCITAGLFLVCIACTSIDNHDQSSGIVTTSLGLLPKIDTNNAHNESAFVEELLSRMSLKEKVGQMVQAEIAHVTPNDIRNYSLGSVLNGGGSHPSQNKHASKNDWRELAQQFHNASTSTDKDRTPIPILWGTDAVHGHNNLYGATIFPHNIGLGAANNPQLTQQIFAATAEDVRSTGIKWVYSPTVAVARDDRWGRTYESFSEDPEIVSRLAEAAVWGLQGSGSHELANNAQVIATSKHFIGDGGTTKGIDQGNTELNEPELIDIHAQSFLAALDAGTQTVMASFNSWNGDKVHGSHYLITELLKQKFQFDGFVIGDWNGHAQVPGCNNSSCAAAINAGIDILMAPKDWKSLIANTIAQVENGEISINRINDAVSRILRVKYRAGLFSDDYRVWFDDNSNNLNKTQALARQAVRESLVLLKNNSSTLPLAQNSNLLVIGEAADTISRQVGGWSLTWQGDGNTNADFPHATSILRGIQTEIEQAGGSVTYDPHSSYAANTPYLGHHDAAIVVIGENPYAEGAGDIDELFLPGSENQHLPIIRKLVQQNVPVIGILLTGRPLSTNNFINATDAFVVAWLPGTEGAGVADVIIGDSDGEPRFDFSGSLSFSWPKSSKQFDINNYPNYDDEPQFKVGYGLSYKKPRDLALLPEIDPVRAANRRPTTSLPIFVKRALQPWTLFVGNEDNWGVEVKGNRGATLDSATVLVNASDRESQEDARVVSWTKGKVGQFYFQHNDAVDLSSLAEQNGALKFKLRVQQPPKGKVSLRMDCHYPCFGAIDLTHMLRKIPANQWHGVSIELTCFEQRGAKLSSINTPFLLSTDNELTLEVSDIVIDTKPAEAMHIGCSNSVSMLENIKK